MNPHDGDGRYWLSGTVDQISENGYFIQECRLGDEDTSGMKKKPPLKFDVYAVAIDKNNPPPFKAKETYFDDKNENDFFARIRSFKGTASEKFAILRVPPEKPDIPMVIIVESPVKIRWDEPVSMYLEFYHHGEIVKEGRFRREEEHELAPSAIAYEVKMSREKGFTKRSIWILVGEKGDH